VHQFFGATDKQDRIGGHAEGNDAMSNEDSEKDNKLMLPGAYQIENRSDGLATGCLKPDFGFLLLEEGFSSSTVLKFPDYPH
jgi:hypothetical protein